MRRALTLAGLAAALLGGPRLAAAQLAASEPATTVLGEVCEDLGADGRCDPADPPLGGVVIRTTRGAVVRTDARGRFRLPVIGARSLARDEVGRLRPRLEQLYLFVDSRFLGGRRSPPAGQWVDLIPGGTVGVTFALALERAGEPERSRAGVETGVLPAAAQEAAGFTLQVPYELRPGHLLEVEGVPVAAGEDGVARLPVPLEGREGVTTFVDRAPDGLAQVLEVRALRVPWENGAQLLVHREVERLAVLELPSGPVAPGRLRVAVRAPPGTTLRLGDAEALTIDESGRGERWIEVAGEPLEIELLRPDGRRRSLRLEVPVDPRLLRTLHVAADLRAGHGDGVFGEGRVELLGELPLLGGTLGGGLLLSDARIVEWGRGGRLLTAANGPVYGRVPDPEVVGHTFADESVFVDENPAALTLWGGWRGEAGEVGFGGGRTPLVGGEVGRFDRATLGPSVDLAAELGSTRVRFAGAADAWGVPLMDDPGVLPAHALLEATGGAFYLLPHRRIAEGSERLWIEHLDPSSGLPLDRRLLRRGRDYELDLESGRVLLAAPLGLSGIAPGGRLGERSLGGPARLVADYHYRPDGAGRGYAAGGARVSVEQGWLRAGVQAAGVNAGRYGLLAGDVALEPLEGLSLSASVARSAGNPFFPEPVSSFVWPGVFLSDAATSLDGGERYLQEQVGGLDEQRGLALAARLRYDAGGLFGLEAMGQQRDRGFADGTGLGGARALGARLWVGDEDLGLFADLGLGEGPSTGWGQYHERQGGSLRGQARLGDFGLSLEGGYRSYTTVVTEGVAGGRYEGHHLFTGLELSWRASESLELLVGHLQGFARGGTGPMAEDPTFTSVGVRTSLPSLGRLEARGGVHLDGRPGLRLSWLAEQRGETRYANFATETDRAWDGQGQASVVGGRQVVGMSTDLFAESRVTRDLAGAAEAGTAVGGRWGEGPLSLTATYERAARPTESLGRLRDGLFLRAGWSGRRLSISAFGENTRAYASVFERAFTRRSVGGLSLHLAPADGLALGLRALTSIVEREGGLDDTAGVEASSDLVYRPARGLLSLAYLHYGLRSDPRVDAAGLWHRRHDARAGLGLGRSTGPTLLLAGVLAVDEARRPSTGEAPAARALVGTLRGSWPLFGRVEPVLELGLRRLWGAGEDLPVATLRAEVLAVLGPLRLGLGGALTGFTGEGTEAVSGEPAAPRIYLVLRGAL
ncbi:MAG: hypothetical protein P1V51_20920 [Deltaproteobacteria bacterium]|nr:hypothetical protein [Deltaproteobacteria bacterium]